MRLVLLISLVLFTAWRIYVNTKAKEYGFVSIHLALGALYVIMLVAELTK